MTKAAAPPAHGAPRADDALARLRELVQGDLGRVNALIVEKMQSPVALIPQLAGHIVVAGGKRLRPILTLASARLFDYRGDHHIALAACVEFIHTASLLHDDVVDGSDLRRGLSTANALWGNQASVLVGDFLFSRAFQLMVEARSLEVLHILADAAATIAEGEVLQLSTANDPATTVEAFMRVIEGKTAALFAAAAEVGPVIAERTDAEAAALRSYGRHLGIAFQLVDDTLDYAAEQAVLGKTIGDDFREGKITLPVILAYGAGDDAERGFWHRVLGDLEQEDGDLERAVRIIHRHGAIETTLERAHDHAEQAKQALASSPASPVRDALAAVADFCVSRAY